MMMRVMVVLRVEMMGILLSVKILKEVVVVRVEMWIDGGGGLWWLVFLVEKMV